MRHQIGQRRSAVIVWSFHLERELSLSAFLQLRICSHLIPFSTFSRCCMKQQLCGWSDRTVEPTGATLINSVGWDGCRASCFSLIHCHTNRISTFSVASNAPTWNWIQAKKVLNIETTKIYVRTSHLISDHFFCFWFSAFAIRLQFWPFIVLPRATQLAWSNNKLKDQITTDWRQYLDREFATSSTSSIGQNLPRRSHRHFSRGIKPTLLSLFCISSRSTVPRPLVHLEPLPIWHLHQFISKVNYNAHIQTFVLL